MDKQRSVHTHFWTDNYIIDLDPIEKLLFLYLLTNDHTNMLGIYELHIRRICFDTGIEKKVVAEIFRKFENDTKMKYLNGFVILVNFSKNQPYNTNMKKSALSKWKTLPLKIRNDEFSYRVISNLYPSQSLSKPFKGLGKDYDKISKSLKPIGEIEIEIEREIEKEKIEKKKVATGITFMPPESLLSKKGFKRTWFEFEKHRTKIGKKMTKRAAELVWKKLEVWDNPIEVLNQSIENGWVGIFELRSNSGSTMRRTNSSSYRRKDNHRYQTDETV